MKKKVISMGLMMFVVLTAISFTSCSSKDYNEMVLGKWKVTQAKSTAVLGSVSVPRDLTNAYRAFEFFENGDCHMTTITKMDPMNNKVIDDRDTIRHYKWSLEKGNTIRIVTPSNYELNYNITGISDTKMNLHGETFDTVPGFPTLGKTQMQMDMNLVKE